MTKYITDINVIFSALISGKDKYLKIFEDFKFLLPDFALEELQYYQELILQKTNLSAQNFKDYTLGLFEHITIIPNLLISTQSYYQAFELCKDVDEKDMVYIALAIEFDCVFITKDYELVTGLEQKGFDRIQRLDDFMASLES